MILTKLLPPEPRGLVEREVAAEAAAAARARDLLVVAAGAGYGKTSLLTALARSVRPAAWLTITSPDRALAYLERALARALGRPPPVHAGSVTRCGASAAARLVNWLAGVLNGDLLLILDDYHKVADVAEVRALMQTLLEYLPSGLHLALGTRVVPDLPLLSRWQACGRAAVIGEDRLRFSRDEAAALLLTAYDLRPDEAGLDQLLAVTEGWALGLQLLGQVVRGHPGREPTPPDQALTPFLRRGREAGSVSASLLFDYFSVEVLKAQGANLRRFIVEASVLDILTPAVCDAVLGRHDSARLLRAVERRGLFLVRVGGDSWRFHNLFRRFLYRELAASGERRLALHRAAGAHFTGAGCAEAAVPHWLAAGEYGRAADCVHGAAHQMIQAGRNATLAYWLDQFPTDTLDRYAHLLYWRGRLLEVQGSGIRRCNGIAAPKRPTGGRRTSPARWSSSVAGRTSPFGGRVSRARRWDTIAFRCACWGRAPAWSTRIT